VNLQKMMTYKVDVSFIPENGQSLIQAIKDSVGVDLVFTIRGLKRMNDLYSEGFREFTLTTFSNVVYGIYPKDHTLKDYALWIIIDSKNIMLILYDLNANSVVGDASTRLKEQFSEREDFERELSFFRKTLYIHINDLFDGLVKGTNIRSEDITHIVKAGDPLFSYVIFDLFPSDDLKRGFVSEFPVVSSSQIGMNDFPNACFIDLGCEKNLDSWFTFIASVKSRESSNDYILIMDDWIGGYNNSSDTLVYISGVVEDELQEKIVDYMKKNLLELPVDVEMVKRTNYQKYIKSYYLSQMDFSDNIKKQNFDIGVLGIW